MLKKLVIMQILLCYFNVTSAQNRFNGSFLMKFKSSNDIKDAPLLFNVESELTGDRIAMEIQDEMKDKGVSKRVLFNPSDSTWTMTIEFNKVKQGTRIHAAAMYRDTVKEKKMKFKSTNETKIIDGYNCKKIILESEKYLSEIWITDGINFNLRNIYKLLSHCGMMSASMRKGDWFLSRKLNGMIMELTCRKKNSEEYYTINISLIKPGEINENFFSTKDFRISEIPEGQNCGLPSEEDAH